MSSLFWSTIWPCIIQMAWKEIKEESDENENQELGQMKDNKFSYPLCMLLFSYLLHTSCSHLVNSYHLHRRRIDRNLLANTVHYNHHCQQCNDYYLCDKNDKLSWRIDCLYSDRRTLSAVVVVLFCFCLFVFCLFCCFVFFGQQSCYC